MTRQEFIDNVTTWSELLDFCCDEDCNICENVYSEDAKDDYFNSELVDMARDADDWRDLQSKLEDIPDGYDYYINDDYDGFRGADDDDFERYKDYVLEWMDDGEYWEEDGEEEEYDEEPAPDDEDQEDEEPVEEEDVSIAELFTTCNSKLQEIDADTEAAARAAEEEDEEAFNDFLRRSRRNGNS